MMQKKIFLLYPYYWPHYKAGGPVQSLYNFVGFFKDEAQLFLVSLDKDMDGTKPELSIILDAWTTGKYGEHIYFTQKISFSLIFSLIRHVKPDVLLINGIFNLKTTLPGLFASKTMGIKCVISPRGMLQSWALEQKPVIKQAFLLFLKAFLGKRVVWHATDAKEQTDIFFNFGHTQNVFVASNVPRKLSGFKNINFPDQAGKIKLVFLSLINPNKNLHIIINTVNTLTNFTLDIYGPISNEIYWEMCKRAIRDPSRIAYKGPVLPWNVPEVLKEYHFFVLLTQGENFGHAIFDSFSSGVPVIISKNTPWINIDSSGAGYYADTTQTSFTDLLVRITQEMSPQAYQACRHSSLQYASDYLTQKNYKQEYNFLLN